MNGYENEPCVCEYDMDEDDADWCERECIGPCECKRCHAPEYVFFGPMTEAQQFKHDCMKRLEACLYAMYDKPMVMPNDMFRFLENSYSFGVDKTKHKVRFT